MASQTNQVKVDEGHEVFLSSTASIKGKIRYLEDSTTPVYTYLGVPFAEPPVGELRLQRPVPKQFWQGQFDATKDGVAPVHDAKAAAEVGKAFGMGKVPETGEDCLNLNIFTPTTSKSAKLPVLVFFYGGGLQTGTNVWYDGTACAALENVVFVAINYRVGILGFFSTGDETCPGNQGLWDQIEGLRWVQKLINKFGGDQDNVTLYGQSAGASCANFHHVMKPSRSLFHRSVISSGVCAMMQPMYLPDECRKTCETAVTLLGLPDGSGPVDVYNTLMKLPPGDILTKLATIYFLPSMDGELFVDDAMKLFKRHDFHSAKSLFFSMSHEGAMFQAGMCAQMPLKTKEDLATVFKMVGGFFAKNYKIDDMHSFAKTVVEEYVKQENPSEEELKEASTKIIGDLIFNYPLNTQLKIHADAFREEVYFCLYEYRRSNSSHPPFVGADHGDDLPMTLGFPFIKEQAYMNWSEKDKEMSRMFMSILCNFVKTGNPNGPSLPVWPTYSTKKPQYLNLSAEPAVVTGDYNSDHFKFWRSLPMKEY